MSKQLKVTDINNIKVINDYVLLSTNSEYYEEFIKSDSSNLLITNTNLKDDHVGVVLKLGTKFCDTKGNYHKIDISGIEVNDVVLYNPNAVKLELVTDEDTDHRYVIVPVYDIDCIVENLNEYVQ